MPYQTLANVQAPFSQELAPLFINHTFYTQENLTQLRRVHIRQNLKFLLFMPWLVLLVCALFIVRAMLWGIPFVQVLYFHRLLIVVTLVCAGALFYFLYRSVSSRNVQRTLDSVQEGVRISFYSEYLHVQRSQPGYLSHVSIYYSLLTQVIETSHLFLLYQPNGSVFLLDKASFLQGNAEQLSFFLRNQISPSHYRTQR